VVWWVVAKYSKPANPGCGTILWPTPLKGGKTTREYQMQGLWRRLTTAVIFVIIMVAGMYTGPHTFNLLFLVITGGCLYEFLTMVLDRNSRRDRVRKALGVAVGLLPFFLISLLSLGYVSNPETFIQVASLLFAPFIFTIFIYELYSNSSQPFENIAYIILGLFYIGIPFALVDFIAFDGEVFYYRVVFGLLLLTWVNDTGAYLVGSQFGKTPLFPRISPNKTWEGSIGGAVTCILFGYILHLVFDEIGLVQWVVLAAIVGVFGGLGDLVESMLKRSVGVKDSGDLLPGHGGLLDRFDAFIFVIPFAAAYILYLR
jgi:phosphatidate cytidylyltransferase